MNSPKTYLIAFLALTTAGGAFLAWQQYGELVELRAAAMNRDERSDLQSRIADLEQQNRDLQDRLNAMRGSDEGAEIAGAGEERSGERGNRGERSRGPDSRGRGGEMSATATALRELMAKPEVQAMMSLQQKAAIDARYAGLFKNLNLTPEQTDKLKTLLAERGNTRRDVEEAARAQGIDPRDDPAAYRKLFADAQNVLNASIKSVIGEQGYAQLQTYEQTMPQRNLVESLQQRLSYTDMPLTSTQTEQLVQILAANAPQRAGAPGSTTSGSPQVSRGPGGPDFGRGGPDFGRVAGVFGGPPPGMGGPGGPTAAVTAAAVTQAQTILAPPQVAALQQIQQQQQAAQQVQQLVRDTISANQPTKASGTGPTSPGGAATPSPSRKRPGGE